jgi:integrase/recombinase XerD
VRRCPVWSQTVKELKPLVQRRDPNEHAFLNRYGQPITRFEIHTMVERYTNKVSAQMPSLKTKGVIELRSFWQNSKQESPGLLFS